MNNPNKLSKKVITPVKSAIFFVASWWKKAWWTKAITIFTVIVFLTLLTGLGLHRWYMNKHSDEPYSLGVTYIADYAESLGLDSKQTMNAIISDLEVDRLRLVSYWNKIEYDEGSYDFNELDWQFKQAEKAGIDVTLAIGMRQPRWPECHIPDWVELEDTKRWESRFDAYLSAVINRYKDSPSLVSYQLENEYFLEAFGECPTPSRERLQQEFDLVKRLDPETPIIMSRSDNFPKVINEEPMPDKVGVSVYRRVWDGRFTDAYFTYPLPAWYYGSMAGLQEILTDRPSVLHEMQMEPWPADGKFIADVSLDEQAKSFKVEDFESRVDFAKRTGLRDIDFWGAEWWYWRMVEKNDPSFWNAAKEATND